MSADLAIRCRCGKLEGRLRDASPGAGRRVTCYCDDCQAFQHALGQADTVLDAHGGTDIYQVTPAKLELTRGLEQLACLRLTPRGTLRWYAACCNTPIGNTLATPALPFVGLVTACLQSDAGLDATIGPPGRGVFGRYARGDRAEIAAHDAAPLALYADFLLRVLGRRLRGDHQRSPFFDPATGRPRAEPWVLDATELAAIRKQTRRAGGEG